MLNTVQVVDVEYRFSAFIGAATLAHQDALVAVPSIASAVRF